MAPILMTIFNHLSITNLLVRRTTYTENLRHPQPVLVARAIELAEISMPVSTFKSIR
jgi:hypothetical protein